MSTQRPDEGGLDWVDDAVRAAIDEIPPARVAEMLRVVTSEPIDASEIDAERHGESASSDVLTLKPRPFAPHSSPHNRGRRLALLAAACIALLFAAGALLRTGQQAPDMVATPNERALPPKTDLRSLPPERDLDSPAPLAACVLSGAGTWGNPLVPGDGPGPNRLSFTPDTSTLTCTDGNGSEHRATLELDLDFSNLVLNNEDVGAGSGQLTWEDGSVSRIASTVFIFNAIEFTLRIEQGPFAGQSGTATLAAWSPQMLDDTDTIVGLTIEPTEIVLTSNDVGRTTENDQETVCAVDLRTLQVAVQAFRAENGRLPVNQAELVDGGWLPSTSLLHDISSDGINIAYVSIPPCLD